MLKEKTKKTAQELQSKSRGTGNRDITKLLFDVADFSFSLGDMKNSVEETKNLIMKYTGSSGCTVMFLDDYGYLWKVGEKTTYPFKLGEGVAGWAAEHKKEVFVEDIQKDKRYKPLFKKSSGSIVSFPIIQNDKVLGVISLTHAETAKDSFPPNRTVIDIFAEKMKGILENVILFHTTETQRDEFQVKKDISNIMESEDSSVKKMDAIKKKVAKFINVNSVTICVTSPIKELLLCGGRNDNQTKLTNDLIELYTKEKGKTHSFLPLSDGVNPGVASKKKPSYATMYPIFSNKNIAGLILIEDRVKNAENLSVLEKKFVKYISAKISKYIAQQQSLKKVFKEKERWRTAFHSADDGIILLTADKRIIEANFKAKEILVLKKTKLAGKNFFSLFKVINPEAELPTLSSIKNIGKLKKADKQELSKKVDSFFSLQKTMKPKEYYIKTKNGRYWVLISIKAAGKDMQADTYAIIHIKDITRRKEIEQDKNEFMSMVSHELRTPLSAMKGFLSMAINKDYGKLNSKQTKALKRVKESNERMVTLVEDILDISRMESGRFNLNKESINLSKITCNIAQELGAKVQEKGITLKIQNKKADMCFKTVAKKSKYNCKDLGIYVLADRDRLIQILGNLIDNAIKYSFDGGTIDIDIKSDRKFAEVSVRDEGVGVAKEDQDKLFRRFSRIHNPLSIQAGGTGLGLYITKKLVLAHNGDISVSSKQGGATTFSVKIPIAKQLPLI